MIEPEKCAVEISEIANTIRKLKNKDKLQTLMIKSKGK